MTSSASLAAQSAVASLAVLLADAFCLITSSPLVSFVTRATRLSPSQEAPDQWSCLAAGAGGTGGSEGSSSSVVCLRSCVLSLLQGSQGPCDLSCVRSSGSCRVSVPRFLVSLSRCLKDSSGCGFWCCTWDACVRRPLERLLLNPRSFSFGMHASSRLQLL